MTEAETKALALTVRASKKLDEILASRSSVNLRFPAFTVCLTADNAEEAQPFLYETALEMEVGRGPAR